MGRALTPIICLALNAAMALADDAAKLDHFEKKIRPVLIAHCYQCHSAAAMKADKLKGGLLLDTRAGLVAGGESGPVIVPGKPTESSLLAALRFEELEMPPAGKLSDSIIADFEKWLAEGAIDPRAGEAVAAKKEIDFTAARNHWSFRPLITPAPPAVANDAWAKNDVDRFILAKLEAAQLTPAADANDAVFLRRLTFDLIGLPPSPEDVASFVERCKTDREAAISDAVDKLLASPHFGERWGRHWLDVVRYAE